MKTLLKLIGLCTFAICLNVGCKKTAFDKDGKNEIKEAFNVKTVKEWYYTVFNKSVEFGISKANNTKLPRWKFANYKKVGNIEFIEVPVFNKNRKVFITPNDNLTEGDKLKMVESSIFTITFIKTDDNKIEVRESEYMPDWEFLKANNFNIADNILSKSNNFTGRVTIKKWDGTVVGMKRMKNGLVIGNYKFVNQKNNTTLNETQYDPNCTYLITCYYERYCSQGEPEECGPWILLYCDDPELQYCDDDYPPTCDPNDQGCLCEYYGVGCGPPPPPPPPEPEQPVAATFNFENIFAVKQSGSSGTNEDWYMKQKVTINGMKYLNTPSNNYYTDFQQNPTFNWGNTMKPYGGLYGYINANLYCFVNGGHTTTTSNLFESNKKFTNTSEGVVYYPNYQNQQGQPAPFYNSYTNTKQAVAETDL